MKSLGEPIQDSAFYTIRIFMICGAAVALAVWRVVAFFPYPGGAYGGWLALTPWQYGMQMPKGSLQLNFTDFVMVGALCWLTRLEDAIPVAVPVMIFLYIYIFASVSSTTLAIDPKRYWGKRTLILFVIPFAFYPKVSWESALISLAAAYLLCYLHLRDFLKEYPWNTISWVFKQEELLAFASRKLPMSGWPYSVLAPDRKSPLSLKNNTVAKLTFIALFIWWMHTVIAIFHSPRNDDSGMFILLVIIVAVVSGFSRLFLLNGTAPPISFWGRILKGYFIIPKYDRIFVAPLIIIAVTVFTVKALSAKNVENVVALTELSIFAILTIATFCPPGIRQWFNTGAFRFARNKMLEKQLGQIAQQKSAVNKPLKEIFLGK
jgi:hypothetical protein